MNIYSNTYSPTSFPRENSQSTDATNSNDFRRVVVTLKSQKSAKRQIHSEALHVCVHLHDLLVPHNVFAPSWLTAVATCYQQSRTFERESLVRGHENITTTTYSGWFLWIYSHHHPINIIALCNIGWLGISGKIRRRRCLAIDVHDCS